MEGSCEAVPFSVPAEDRPDFDALFRLYYGRLARVLYRVTGDMGSPL
jgi:DNA-directed RNA polymerase specialized sigma24 family protein